MECMMMMMMMTMTCTYTIALTVFNFTFVRFSLNAVDRKQRKVSTAITVNVKAKIVFNLAKNVFILDLMEEKKHKTATGKIGIQVLGEYSVTSHISSAQCIALPPIRISSADNVSSVAVLVFRVLW
jgi:ribosomal protein S8